MVSIRQTVGRGAANRQSDVAVIQAALAQVRAPGMRRLWPGRIDGRGSGDLVAAIGAFQAARRLPATGRIDPFGPALSALRRALPMALRDLRGLKDTAAVFVSSASNANTEARILELMRTAPLPGDMTTALGRLIRALIGEDGLVAGIGKYSVTADGRFAAALDLGKVRFLDPATAKPKPAGQIPHEAVRRICRLARRQPALAEGSMNDLTFTSRVQLDSLRGPRPLVETRARAAGIAPIPADPVLRAIAAAALWLIETRLIGRDQGRTELARLIDAARGADDHLAKQVEKLAPSSTGEARLNIQFDSRVDPTTLTVYSRAVLNDVMRAAGIESLRITSTFRSPEMQARIMFDQIDRRGEKAARRLYNATAEQVLDVYVALRQKRVSDTEIITAMADKIRALRLKDPRAFKHVADPKILNTLDIAPSSIPVARRDAFRKAIANESRISRFLGPPVDEAFHLEIPQP